MTQSRLKIRGTTWFDLYGIHGGRGLVNDKFLLDPMVDPTGHKWYLNGKEDVSQKYITRKTTPDERRKYGWGTTVRLQNVIATIEGWKIPLGCTVDHINRNKCDNRLSNLRVATPEMQSMNQEKPISASGYRGVALRPGGKFQASINLDGVWTTLGTWDTAQKASAAYEAARAQKWATAVARCTALIQAMN